MSYACARTAFTFVDTMIQESITNPTKTHMRNLLVSLALLFTLSTVQAQTLTLTAGLAEVSGTAKTNLYPLSTLYFIYNSTTGGFEARDVETRSVVYAASISTVTISGLSTAASKIAWLENTHVKANTRTYSTLVPRTDLAVKYKTSGKGVELSGRFSAGKTPIWYGHIDSVKTGSTDTTTTLRLAALRKAVRGATPTLIGDASKTPTIAAGAAAGSSPTISIAGSALSGEITLNTGSSTTSTGVVATVTLPVAFPNGCDVFLTPSSDVAGPCDSRKFVTTTSSTFVINAITTAWTASTNGIKFRYFVVGR